MKTMKVYCVIIESDSVINKDIESKEAEKIEMLQSQSTHKS